MAGVRSKRVGYTALRPALSTAPTPSAVVATARWTTAGRLRKGMPHFPHQVHAQLWRDWLAGWLAGVA